MEKTTKDFVTCAENILALQNLYDHETVQTASALLKRIVATIPAPQFLTASGPADASAIQAEDSSIIKTLCGVIPDLQLKLISDLDVSLVTKSDQFFWHYQLLDTTYSCFKSLRVRKFLQLSHGYFYHLLEQCCVSLSKLHMFSENIDEKLALLLLRIVYACTAGLSIQSVDSSTVVRAIVPYFSHSKSSVRVAARNASQFLISVLSEPFKKFFVMSGNDVMEVVSACGKDMPVSSTLKVLHSYAQLPNNRKIFMAKGVLLLAVTHAYLSTREIERNMALALIATLLSEVESKEEVSPCSKVVSLLENIKDHLSILYALDEIKCAEIQALLNEVSSITSSVQFHLLTGAVYQPLIHLISTLEVGWSNPKQFYFSSSLIASLWSFWVQFSVDEELAKSTECEEFVKKLFTTINSPSITELDGSLTLPEYVLKGAKALLLLVIKVLESQFVVASADSVLVLSFIKHFADFAHKEIRILSLIVVTLLLCGNFDSDSNQLLDVTEEDVLFLLKLIETQQLVPISHLLSLVVAVGSVSVKNQLLFEKLNVLSVLNSLHLKDTASFSKLNSFKSSSSLLKSLKSVSTSVREPPIANKSSLPELMLKLSQKANQFKVVLLEGKIDDRDCFLDLMEVINSVENSLLENEAREQIFDTLLNLLCEVTAVLIKVEDNQLLKWSNVILVSSWSCFCLKEISETLLAVSKIPSLVDNLLKLVTHFCCIKRFNEVSVKCLKLYLTLLEDLLYKSMIPQKNIGTLLDAVKETLTATTVLAPLLAIASLKSSLQFILCYLLQSHSIEEELLSVLTVDRELISHHIKPVLTSASCKKQDLHIMIKKIKALAIVPKNRSMMRQQLLLQDLQVVLETHSDSTLGVLAADVICTLLSDEETQLEDDSSTSTHYLEDESLEISIDVDQFIQRVNGPSACSSKLLVLHAELLLKVFFLSTQQFQQIQRGCLVSSKYLIECISYFTSLCRMYEECEDGPVLNEFGKQLVYLFEKHLPNLACVSFQAMKDVYSDSMPEMEKKEFVKSVLQFLHVFQFCVEHWSKISSDVQKALIDYGAFHLILNEFHTAPSTELVTNDLVYAGLSSLYNVILNPRNAVHFRMAITKKLLNYFLASEDDGVRYLAKFSLSCLQMLLSQSERNALNLVLSKIELSMLGRCLEGIDKFFVGQINLLITISNLALCCSKNCELFVSSGIVNSIAKIALGDDGDSRKYALLALLHMIPLFDIPDSDLHVTTKDLKRKMKTKNFASPVVKTVKTIPALMSFVSSPPTKDDLCEICNAIFILICHKENPDLKDISALYNTGRYSDCWLMCQILLDNNSLYEVKVYQAKSAYHDYNRELMHKREQSSHLPGFEYKKMMQVFCRKRILPVTKILTLIVEEEREKKYKHDSEVVQMLDKALLDFLVFNNFNVTTCLLCHCYTEKLVLSHYIPKTILQSFVKSLGFEPGASVYVFNPGEHPSEWQFKPASKIAFPMLCSTCDNRVLSRDELMFKVKVFDKIYDSSSAESYLFSHSIPYSQFLYRFASGLLFRSIAPLYSEVCSEIGNFISLHELMLTCRRFVLCAADNFCNKGQDIYLLALPFQLPSSLPPITGWENYVQMANSPYCAYKLLRPGEPMVPKKLYFCMVKIGILLFVAPFDTELMKDLAEVCGSSRIHEDEDNFVLHIPENLERQKLIPTKLFWSLMGWARKEISTAATVAFATEAASKGKTSSNAKVVADAAIRSSSAKSHPVVANMLPPGFELNFEKHGTLPQDVVKVPQGHAVLLHQSFLSAEMRCYLVLAKLEEKVPSNKGDKQKQPVYSVFSLTYALVYMHKAHSGVILKAGFCIDEECYLVKSNLPGCPNLMKESPYLQDLISSVPIMVQSTLRSKGFRNLKSLLFWHESLMNMKQAKDVRYLHSLDTRCTNKEKCIYCDMRCDFCLSPCLKRDKVKHLPRLGEIQSCSNECSSALFTGKTECFLERIQDNCDQFCPSGHQELFRGHFSVDHTCDSEVKTLVTFSLCQVVDQNKFSIPIGIRYIKMRQKCVEKPYSVEYEIDDHVKAVKVINFGPNYASAFSTGEETEIMYQLHHMLVRIGIPYHVTLNLL